jgi:hypothetical protein
MKVNSQHTEHLSSIPDFEKAEMDLLRASLKRTYEERFKMMTALMKMGMMLKKAKIKHKKDVHKT